MKITTNAGKFSGIFVVLVAAFAFNSKAQHPDLFRVANSPPVNIFTTASYTIPPDKTLTGPSFSIRREHRANRLLISGGICLAVGIPLFITGVIVENKPPDSSIPAANSSGDLPKGVALGALGAFTTAAGIGLTIPGIHLKLKNHLLLKKADLL